MTRSESATDSTTLTCAYCGDALDLNTWTPTTFERDESETGELYRFCDESCRSGWESERRED